jgi:hypothetical protein
MPLPNSINTRGRTGVLGGVLLLCASLFLPGCDSLVDVENPNNVLDEEIRNASGAPALANGALYTVQDGWDAMLAPYSVVSDELHFVGARGWQVLDWCSPDDPTNEFLDRFFPVLATARWMADETIEILGSLDSAGELTDRTQLARSYLYAALAYVSIGLSDRTTCIPCTIKRSNISPPAYKSSRAASWHGISWPCAPGPGTLAVYGT